MLTVLLLTVLQLSLLWKVLNIILLYLKLNSIISLAHCFARNIFFQTLYSKGYFWIMETLKDINKSLSFE